MSGFSLPALDAIIACPLRARGHGDGKMLRVGDLNARDHLGYGLPREADANRIPGGAAIRRMIEGAACAPRPDIIANGGNRHELDAGRNGDRTESFPTVRGALHLAIRRNVPEGRAGSGLNFHFFARRRHFMHGRLGCHPAGGLSAGVRCSFRGGKPSQRRDGCGCRLQPFRTNSDGDVCVCRARGCRPFRLRSDGFICLWQLRARARREAQEAEKAREKLRR